MKWIECPEVEQTPEKGSGSCVLKGTRVPVRSLFDNLEDGATVEQFPELHSSRLLGIFYP